VRRGGAAPSPAVFARAPARGADFSSASSDIKAIGAFFCNEQRAGACRRDRRPRRFGWVETRKCGPPRTHVREGFFHCSRKLGRTPNSPAAAARRRLSAKSPIPPAASLTMVTGCGRRIGETRFLPHFLIYQGLRVRKFSSASSRGDLAKLGARGIAAPRTQRTISFGARSAPGAKSGAAVGSGVLQCTSMGAFLGRRRAMRNDSTDC
jgi:hypothetical protein